MQRHNYASPNSLQTIDILETNQPNGIWIVFIHGGYFRDPLVDSTAFNNTMTLLESNKSYKSRVTGYASINYRLSPQASHPQPPDTPSYELNNARWPDQPNDIIAALRFLQSTHPSATNYILSGHSVGATLTFFTGLNCAKGGLAVPRALVGVSGIYDFPKIHASHPAYAALTGNAMDEKWFEEASPALHVAEEYSKAGFGGRVLVAHSRDDGLVPWDQAVEMVKVFETDESMAELMEVYGTHDEIWQKSELSRVIQRVLDLLEEK